MSIRTLNLEADVCEQEHVHEDVVDGVRKQSKLVKSKKVGKEAIYSLADEHVATILKNGMEHIEE